MKTGKLSSLQIEEIRRLRDRGVVITTTREGIDSIEKILARRGIVVSRTTLNKTINYQKRK
jgi:hypothetical protein